MNGGNESSGADRAGGPVATSVPIGWQRCVREGAVLYIRCGSPKFPSFYPQALQLPEFSLFYFSLCPDRWCPVVVYSSSFLSLFALCASGPVHLFSPSLPYSLPFLGRSLNCSFRVSSSSVLSNLTL